VLAGTESIRRDTRDMCQDECLWTVLTQTAFKNSSLLSGFRGKIAGKFQEARVSGDCVSFLPSQGEVTLSGLDLSR
jgi:hypothetical protein